MRLDRSIRITVASTDFAGVRFNRRCWAAIESERGGEERTDGRRRDAKVESNRARVYLVRYDRAIYESSTFWMTRGTMQPQNVRTAADLAEYPGIRDDDGRRWDVTEISHALDYPRNRFMRIECVLTTKLLPADAAHAVDSGAYVAAGSGFDGTQFPASSYPDT